MRAAGVCVPESMVPAVILADRLLRSDVERVSVLSVVSLVAGGR